MRTSGRCTHLAPGHYHSKDLVSGMLTLLDKEIMKRNDNKLLGMQMRAMDRWDDMAAELASVGPGLSILKDPILNS